MTEQTPKFAGSSIYLKFEKIYFSFAAVSLMLVFWQYWGMDRYVEIYPSNSKVSVSGDYLNGGESEGTIELTEDGAKLHCDIKLSSTFAYCTLVTAIGDGGNNGIDFSHFDHLNLWLEHETNEQDTVIIYLKNRERSSDDLDPSSRNRNNKSNQHTILPRAGDNFYKLPLNQFSVPSWWILLHEATGITAKASLDNVIELEIATGDSNNIRSVDILLKKATVTGKWLAANTLYLILAIFWAMVITLHASFRVYQLANQLQLKRSQNALLEELNHFLSIQKDEFEVLSKTDPLTGLLNRAGTRDLFEQMQNKQNKVYSLIMFDIDKFKEVNDIHGHELGDEILRELSDLVASLVRDADHVARWGGEEFIIVAPDTNAKSAAAMANHLRKEIASKVFKGGLSVTCSFGLAEYKHQGKNSIKKLFEATDAALYRAKAGGRNRVEY
ncbi:MAG: diguanylate cyclase (GGDEF)-like protein [Glaciecola sp.]|jgi:diguanylate cyclase (GGDEF)-like protein